MKGAAWIRAGIVTGFALVLEAFCRLGVIPVAVMISPSAMFAALWRILASGQYNEAIGLTLLDVAIAAALAASIGLCAGVAIHASPRARRILDPLLTSYYAVPTFLFYPIFILYLGVGRISITALATMMGVVIMIVSTLAGLDGVPRILMRTAKAYRMSAWSRAVFIQFPAAAPFLMSGVKLVVAYSFIGVLAAEFIMSGSGIGYSIADAYNEFDNATMYGLMLLVVIVVTLVNGVLQICDDRLTSRRLK